MFLNARRYSARFLIYGFNAAPLTLYSLGFLNRGFLATTAQTDLRNALQNPNARYLPAR